jgi:hypothetical protein
VAGDSPQLHAEARSGEAAPHWRRNTGSQGGHSNCAAEAGMVQEHVAMPLTANLENDATRVREKKMSTEVDKKKTGLTCVAGARILKMMQPPSTEKK